MIFHDADMDRAFPSRKVSWEAPPVALISGSEPWLRSTRRAVVGMRDEQGHLFPLRDEQIWVNVSPTSSVGLWRAEAEAIGSGVVGHGGTLRESLLDWRKRFRMAFQVHLSMRPFEMTLEDRDFWDKVQAVIDIPLYMANKPMIIRQTGVVRKASDGLIVGAKWADGSNEEVKVSKFDEPFSRYRAGQPFEATVTRHPTTFRLLRADAVRKLPPRITVANDGSDPLWDRVVGAAVAERLAAEPDEDFWLSPPQETS